LDTLVARRGVGDVAVAVVAKISGDRAAVVESINVISGAREARTANTVDESAGGRKSGDARIRNVIEHAIDLDLVAVERSKLELGRADISQPTVMRRRQCGTGGEIDALDVRGVGPLRDLPGHRRTGTQYVTSTCTGRTSRTDRAYGACGTDCAAARELCDNHQAARSHAARDLPRRRIAMPTRTARAIA